MASAETLVRPPFAVALGVGCAGAPGATGRRAGAVGAEGKPADGVSGRTAGGAAGGVGTINGLKKNHHNANPMSRVIAIKIMMIKIRLVRSESILKFYYGA